MNTNENVEAQCTECRATRKGTINITGNFINHYKTHPDRAKDLDNYLKQQFVPNAPAKTSIQPGIRDVLPAASEDVVIKSYKL